MCALKEAFWVSAKPCVQVADCHYPDRLIASLFTDYPSSLELKLSFTKVSAAGTYIP